MRPAADPGLGEASGGGAFRVNPVSINIGHSYAASLRTVRRAGIRKIVAELLEAA